MDIRFPSVVSVGALPIQSTGPAALSLARESSRSRSYEVIVPRVVLPLCLTIHVAWGKRRGPSAKYGCKPVQGIGRIR